jgi:1-deoxy-D-xylulose-5-phosphate synthase
MIKIMENIRNINEPVLLHVTTKKGKGYPPAEKNPVYFHGVGSFEVETGVCRGGKSPIPTFTDVFGKTMVKLAEKDKKVIAVTAAMPEGTGLVEFSQRFPTRFYDVGIAEQHGVTFAAGMATEGFKPVVAIYSTFLQRGYDQILHDVCLESLPVVFAIDRGGIVGEDGPTHHGLFDFAFLRTIPNMVVMAPKDENELSRMIATAIAHPGPIAFRYPRGKGLGVCLDDNPAPLAIGKAEILTHGNDVLLLAIGRCVSEALKAEQVLREKGFSVSVVNCRFVKPLDSDLICQMAEQIPRIITIEEHMLQGGFGSAVLECLSDGQITGYSLKRVGIEDTFVEHGPQDLLRSKYQIDSASIVQAAEELIKKCPLETEND